VVTNADYEKKIKTYQWPALQSLHAEIVARATPGWPAGKALEYLIVRAFELDGANVRWPYDTRIDGEVVEQIDGNRGQRPALPDRVQGREHTPRDCSASKDA
jgi:hypothetical protein